MKDKPSNVKLSKWLPQEAILAHPNLKLFVTHGGQSSSQEALCHKKPTGKSRYRYFLKYPPGKKDHSSKAHSPQCYNA